VNKPITIEELKKRGWDSDCLYFLVEWAKDQLREDRSRVDAALAIIESREGDLEQSQILAGNERIEEWESEQREAAD
jgi:hypothetical protein